MSDESLSDVHTQCASILGLGRFPKPGEMIEAVDKLMARLDAGREEVARLNAAIAKATQKQMQEPGRG